MIKGDAPDAPKAPDADSVKTHAFKDAQSLEKTPTVTAKADAYHAAYASFAGELQSLKPQDQAKALSSYRTEMGRALGPAQLQQLELTYAGQHMSELSSANQQIAVQHHGGRGYLTKQVTTENLDAQKIASFKSTSPNIGEQMFQSNLAGDIAAAHKKGDFSHGYFLADNSYITKADVLAKAQSPEFEKQKAARSEALGLYSPISSETAKQFGVATKDGAAPILYDLLADKNGSINKYGYQTKFQQVHDRLRAGDLTEEQTKAVNDLWSNWGDAAKNPLRDSRTGNISADSIKKATGETAGAIREAAEDRQKIQQNAIEEYHQMPRDFDPKADLMIRLDSLRMSQIQGAFSPELDAKAKEQEIHSSEGQAKLVQQQAEQDNTPARTFTLDGHSLLDQARKILKDEAKDHRKAVSDQEARALVAEIAKANKLPGSEQQWQAFVRDGKQSHLPKSLNQLLHTGLQLALPTDS